MKTEITALDLRYLVKEFKILEGGKIDQIYQTSKKDFLIRFHVPSKGKVMLRLILPKFVYITDYKGGIPEKPLGFCLFLRKYLRNARVRKVLQEDFERILVIEFEKEKKYNLIIELFAKGNMILCDTENKIIGLLEQQRWKDRDVKAGIKYEVPKRKYDFLKLKEIELKEIAKQEKEIVKALAVDLGLGGVYAEEICFAAEIDKKKKKLNPEELKKLYKAIKELRLRKPKPIIYSGKDIMPFELGIHEGKEKRNFKSFNEAIDKVITISLKESDETKKKSKYADKIKKTEKIIEMQKKNIEKLEKEMKENTAKGEKIYENYKLMEQILEEIKKARKKYSWEQIKAKLKGHKIIKEINIKEKKAVIELK